MPFLEVILEDIRYFPKYFANPSISIHPLTQ